MDTLRRDAIQPYSKTVPTPNIFSFSKDSNVFDNAIAPAPWTVPSHASLFTGLYPSEHGIQLTEQLDLDSIIDFARAKLVSNKENNLAYTLRKSGYTTYAVTANPYLSPGSGFDEGFDILTNIDFSAVRYKSDVEEIRKKYGELSSNKVLKIIKMGGIKDLYRLYRYYNKIYRSQIESGMPSIKGGDSMVNIVNNSSLESPFFLFLNTMEMHEPYLKREFRQDMKNPIPPRPALDLYGIKPYSTITLDRIRAAYYKQAEISDNLFGKIISRLKSNGLYDDSLIILTSDHGNALREKNYYGHGIYLYEEIINIPLIIKFPKNRKIDISRGYQTLVKLKEFIMEATSENLMYDTLSTQTVFSEEPKNKRLILSNDFSNTDLSIHASRKAVYKNGFKATVNGSTGSLEEFLKNGLPVKPDTYASVLDDLLNELEIFKGNEKFLIPNRR